MSELSVPVPLAPSLTICTLTHTHTNTHTNGAPAGFWEELSFWTEIFLFGADGGGGAWLSGTFERKTRHRSPCHRCLIKAQVAARVG